MLPDHHCECRFYISNAFICCLSKTHKNIKPDAATGNLFNAPTILHIYLINNFCLPCIIQTHEYVVDEVVRTHQAVV